MLALAVAMLGGIPLGLWLLGWLYLGLVPVLEGHRLRWPRLRRVALWSLTAGILLRSAEVLVGLGWTSLASWMPLSGILVWIAVAWAAVNLMASIGARARGVA